MPLPIGDATATPGSPISGPVDASPVAPDQAPSAKAPANQPGNTTVEDDDIVDDLHQYANSAVGRAVPTTIEWTAGGNKVYVTGTFVNWEKKFRLHRRSVALNVYIALAMLIGLLLTVNITQRSCPRY